MPRRSSSPSGPRSAVLTDPGGGRDLRERPLLERKRRLAKIIPYDYDTRLRLLGHVPGRGRDLFRLVCDIDAEGIVAKWNRGRYPSDGNTTSWLKIKNPDYSQAAGRHEFFEGKARRDGGRGQHDGLTPRRSLPPVEARLDRLEGRVSVSVRG
jgi:hypothetical protein